MTTVILAAHGELAKGLLGSAAMICGESDQFEAVVFQPREGPDDLVAKYQQIISAKQPDKLLFLVDLFGGSPYNAALRIAAERDNCDVVSGVNLPMVMQVMMALDDDDSIEHLVQTALDAVSDGVQTFSGKSLTSSAALTEVAAPDEEDDYRAGRPTEGHMEIPLLRIDSRLIHGQVATSWAKAIHCDAIFAISDEVASDELRANLLLQVAPPNIQSYVISVDKAIKVWKNPMYADRHVMWLVTKPGDIVRLIEGGVDIKKVNVGGMTHHQGCQMLSKSVAVDKDDVAAFRKLDEMGIDMTIQQLAAHSPEALVPKLDSVKF